MSHDVVASDMDRDLSTAYCWSSSDGHGETILKNSSLIMSFYLFFSWMVVLVYYHFSLLVNLHASVWCSERQKYKNFN